MIVRDLGERGLISAFVAPELARFRPKYQLDDAAVIDLDSERALLISTDAGPSRTFLRSFDVGTLIDLGHFFANMSLSDIAAMGGIPYGIVAAVQINPELDTACFADLISGLSAACLEAQTAYLGGDTKPSDEMRVVTTAIGWVLKSEIMSRRGAKPGDVIFISGPIGRTLSSYVHALEQSKRKLKPTPVNRPTAKLAFARQLASQHLATSCIDMSDGPAAAARELAELNHVDLTVDIAGLQLSKPPDQDVVPETWYNLLVNAGGDLELMFTAPEALTSRIEQLGGIRCGRVESFSDNPEVNFHKALFDVKIQPVDHFQLVNWVGAMQKEMFL